MTAVTGFTELSTALQRMAAAAANPTRMLKRCREHILNDVSRNFEDEEAPGGEKWDPLAVATLLNRTKGKGSGSPKILRDTSTLARSFTGQVTVMGSSGVLEVGTNDPKAKFHQDAGGNGPSRSKIPERPMIGFDDDLAALCLGEIEEELERIVSL
ncbi:MAG: phage virion morphogenesis protein [Deltaproteobacteria bacterium]|nr:phage virion morphogenesis protein [Deltaproteobacteria bacterium]